MNMIGEFANRLIGSISPIFDWALNNWAITMMVLIMMIYRSGKQRRLYQHRH
jgi:hypothetical protein